MLKPISLANLCVLAALLIIAVTTTRADVPVPPLKSRVTDLTATLSAAQQGALEETLRAFEARKGSQIAVLIVPTTRPETVEQYAVRVEEVWKLGRKGIGDGVLLLIAKDDRRLRIEVGYGLEGALNDAIAKRIISDDITPRFKQGDFYGGVSAGVARIIKVIDSEPLQAGVSARPTGEVTPRQREDRLWREAGNTVTVTVDDTRKPAGLSRSGGADTVEGMAFIGTLLGLFAGFLLRKIFDHYLAAAGILGAIAGTIGWMVGGGPTAIIAGVLVSMFLLGLFYLTPDPNTYSSSSSSWGTRDSSSSSSSGSSGSSDFGGGGGSSGGGGASGSW